MSLTKLQDIPSKNTILFVGPPGAGKSTFCQQTVLQNLAMDKPVIFATTDYSSQDAEIFLRKKGLAPSFTGILNYIDGYNQTVGLPLVDRSDIINVNCGNLTYLGIAIAKHQRRIGKKGILLVFDSLTSPYLFCGSEIVRFLRLSLSRFAGDGNAVLACFDEGSEKEHDLVGMMSVSDGVVRINAKENQRVFQVIKHPILKPKKIIVPLTSIAPKGPTRFDPEYLKQSVRLYTGTGGIVLRKESGDFVNLAWRNLIFWSGMLWDPKRFPNTVIDSIRYGYDQSNWHVDLNSLMSWKRKLAFKLFVPKNLSKVKSMKRLARVFSRVFESDFRIGKIEYLTDISREDEHYYRMHEYCECWGFENIGAPLSLVRTVLTATSLGNVEKAEREWSIREIKCIGLGDSYCEFIAVPKKIEDFEKSFEKERIIVEKVIEKLMNHILGYLLHGKPLMERPTLGGGVHIHEVQKITDVPLVFENLQPVIRMMGAKMGKVLAEKLQKVGLQEQKAVELFKQFLVHCKVGIVNIDKTIRIQENCERFGMKTKEPSCFFTTGFINGFFNVIKNQNVNETKCIGNGYPYCEWEFVKI